MQASWSWGRALPWKLGVQGSSPTAVSSFCVTLDSHHLRLSNFKASNVDKMISMFLEDRTVSYLLFPVVSGLRGGRVHSI